MHSALGLSIVHVHSRPKSLHLARTRQAVQDHAVSLPVLVFDPGQQGRRYFRWIGHAASHDAASALTYHRILRCNSRCSQETQLTEPRILAPMGCPHRCDRPAASLSTVRKGRQPLGAQTLIPELHALLQGLLPASHQQWGPFRCRSFDTDAIQVRQCRLSLTRLSLPQIVPTIWGSRSPLQGFLSYKKRKKALPAGCHCTLPVQRAWAICVQRHMQRLVRSRNQQGGAPGYTILSQTGS